MRKCVPHLIGPWSNITRTEPGLRDSTVSQTELLSGSRLREQIILRGVKLKMLFSLPADLVEEIFFSHSGDIICV